MWPKNSDTGNVCFSIMQKLEDLVAGQILEVYEPKKPKVAKYCRSTMVITQADNKAMILQQDEKTGQQYYLMAYKLSK